MRNSKGEVLEDKMNSSPVHYLQGGKTILPVIQQQMEGLRAGDQKRVVLRKAESESDDDYMFDVEIDEVREATREEIILGYALETPVEACGDDCSCHDNNAGYAIVDEGINKRTGNDNQPNMYE
jgi:FKBP-type peptidyl-prolyl cis-trans isomerase 2